MTRRAIAAACLSAAVWITSITPAVTGEYYNEVDVASLEVIAASSLPNGEWSAEAVRELADRVSTMPDFVAAQALWLAATAPLSVDATTVFAKGLQSPSPTVRGVASSIMAGLPSPAIQRMLITAIAAETDPEIVHIAVGGLSRLPRNQAVNALMEIMHAYGAQDLLVEETGIALRRLTEADVPNNASAWRDWWLDHQDTYSDRPNGE